MSQNARSVRNSKKDQPSGPRLRAVAGVLVVFVLSAGIQSAGAQVGRSNPGQPVTAAGAASKRAADSIPTEYQPPAGMCRVWVEGVPAAQQPAPTDCATAALKKPANARVIYGEAPRKGGKPAENLPIKGLAPPGVIKRSPVNAAIPPTPRGDVSARDPREDKRISDEQLFGDRPASMPASSYPGAGYPGQQAGYPNSNQGGNGVLGDPRYFNNAGVRPPGYGSGSCLDRDQDGWCDDSRFGPPVCLDQDKDGRCDDLPEFASAAYPQTLPRMRSALDVVEGRGSVEVMRWIGTNEFTVRLPDGGGTPWRAIFLDGKNELMQVWTDRNRDGLAERVEIFRNGQRVKLIQR